MAHSFQYNSQHKLSLNDYVSYITDNVDVFDQSSLFESAEALYRLSLDRTLLDDIIISPIKNIASGIQSQNVYTDATFILEADAAQSFFIRANVWKKPRLLAGSMEFENRLYSYEQPHDHNFDFLTVGYYGPGYRTLIYEYDHGSVIGRLGEPVAMQLLEDTHLPQGKVMMYRRSQDIHTQLPPESMSISLNLMVPSKEQRYNQQYSFDLDAGTLAGFVDGHSSYRVSVIDLVGSLGDANSLEPLMAIAMRNPCARARASAVRGALSIAPQERDRMLSSCGTDPSAIVREALELC